ncbi:branched-chain amino acid ABC transporter permease [Arenibaculum pallidiluteum]|uniref:branched-chain amino acid ABC transporter permease n=1 Tax=Arenibaculum pallidiluteum TaxID=2812559 RepID=UPI001A97307F|nr:branched-chain amino acid ABC transporter permease [Arenibaculum pallidiluteum]
MTLERNTLLVALVGALLLPFAVTDQYLLHLAVMALFYVVLATSLNLVVGYVGEFSLGHTAFLGTGAYTAALLSTHAGLPLWITVPVAGLVAAAFGFAIGAITLRLQGPYFVIVTLAFAEVLRLVANNWIAVTNGPMGLAGIGQSGLTDKREFYFVILALAALALYLSYRFVYSNAGRAAVAVRENRYVAQSIGVDPFGAAMQAFVLGAFMAGLAGGFYAHYISFVGPEVFQFAFMATIIIMVLMGGKGTLVGPIVGAVIVTLLEEYLREVQELRLTLFGLIVMAIVLFLPNGLMGFVARRREQHGSTILRNTPAEEKTV